ncbi:RNA-binding domain-containing protein [Candidatus Poribacteria bacterium]
MNERQLLKLIERGEGQSIEFKPSLSQGRRLIQIIASFANSSGGHLLVGIRADGSISGVELGKKTLERLSNTILDNVDPEIYPRVEVVKAAGRDIIVVTVDESDEKPHLAYGKAFKRVGAVTKEVSRAEYERLLRARSEEPFEQTIVRNTTLDDLDETKINAFLQRKAERSGTELPKAPLERILSNLGAVVKKDDKLSVTYAGLLFFGKDPQKSIKRSQLKLARFEGTAMVKFLDETRTKGRLPEMLDEAERFIRRNTRHAQKVVGFKGQIIHEYPYPALREALVNAMAHRDYYHPSSIQVMIFDDRIEIASPGGIPKGLSLREVRGMHVPRNETLCERFHDVGEMEEYGTGLRKMENLMLSHGLRKPVIRATKSFFRTIFNGPGDDILELTPDAPEEDTIDLSHLNERQMEIVELIVNSGREITTREYSRRFRISRYSAIRDLNGIIESGLVKKVGAGRGVKYVPVR